MNTTASELAIYMFFIIVLGLGSAFAYEAYSKASGLDSENLLKFSAIFGISSFGVLIIMTGLYIIFSEEHHRKGIGRMAAHVFALLAMGATLATGVLAVFAALRLGDEPRNTPEKKDAYKYAIVTACLTLTAVGVFGMWAIYSASQNSKKDRIMNERLMRQQEMLRRGYQPQYERPRQPQYEGARGFLSPQPMSPQ